MINLEVHLIFQVKHERIYSYHHFLNLDRQHPVPTWEHGTIFLEFDLFGRVWTDSDVSGDDISK